jgi:chromatin structure-remodeling complex subunit RSC9
MFVARPDGEMSQVEFWTLYKDTFAGYSDQSLMLAAPELIKGISNVFPTAHAVCLEGPVPRWIMRGVARRVEDRALCQWERGRCAAAPPERRAELVEHVRQHIVERVEDALPCLWGACTHPPLPKAALWPHVVTHLQGALPPSVAALPAETVLVSAHAAAPAAPAAPAVAVTLAKNEPPQLSLTALLCVRLLFHLSFSAAGAAPRVDAEHFGFPGVVEEDEAGDVAAVSILGEEEGERRGRHAFVGVRHLMERVRIKDDALMGWMTEMVEVSTYTEAV